MTSRRTKLAVAVSAAALSATGFGVLAAPAGAATATPSAAAAACDRAPWEAKVQGAPKGFGAGSAGGDYLWHDTHGFHLRVTHGRNHDQRVYSGTINSSAPMRVERVKLEKGDSVKLAANRRSLVFVFANHGYIDGINFHTDCAKAAHRVAAARRQPEPDPHAGVPGPGEGPPGEGAVHRAPARQPRLTG